MDLLAKLEHALEGMVEGIFSRAFKAPLQPVEVAKRLTREMENHRTVSVNATYVPNVYIVHLSPETFQAFESMSGALLGELESYLREFTAERQYQTVGPITVQLSLLEDLTANETVISVNSDADAISSAPVPVVLRSPAPSEVASEPVPAVVPASELRVISGNAVGQQLPLSNGLTIGRDASSSLVLADAGVSRRHAEIVSYGANWVVRDLDSTNGTYVNDKRVTSQVIHAGDTLLIGQIRIQVS